MWAARPYLVERSAPHLERQQPAVGARLALIDERLMHGTQPLLEPLLVLADACAHLCGVSTAPRGCRHGAPRARCERRRCAHGDEELVDEPLLRVVLLHLRHVLTAEQRVL